ncbi:MAG: DNA repair protein RecO [bacterium]
MFTHYRTQGFILKKEDRGEADRVFTVYTKDFGKLDLLAKAERKIKSKLRGGLELFYLSEIEFIQGKAQKTLTDSILINSFSGLRKDLTKLALAYKISESLDSLIKGEEPDKNVWSLLNETLRRLNLLEIRNLKLEILYFYFFWNLLSILGYRPEVNHCSLCQKKLSPENLFFNLSEGGLICQNCAKLVKSVKEITPEAVKVMRVILKKDWPTLSKLKIEKSYLDSLNKISEDL